MRASNRRSQRVGVANLAIVHAGDNKVAMLTDNCDRVRCGNPVTIVEQVIVVSGKGLAANVHSGAVSIMQVNRERTRGLLANPHCNGGFYRRASGKVAFVHGKGRNFANIGGSDGVHRHGAGISLVAVGVGYRGRELDGVIGITIRSALWPRVGELVRLVVVRKLVGGVAVAVLERPAAISVFNAREDLLCAVAFNSNRHVLNVVGTFRILQRARDSVAGISHGHGRGRELHICGGVVKGSHVERGVGNAAKGRNANGKGFGRLGIPTSVVFLRASNRRGQRVGVVDLAADHARDHKITMLASNGDRTKVGDQMVIVEQHAIVHGEGLIANGYCGVVGLVQIKRERATILLANPPCVGRFHLGTRGKIAFVHGKGRDFANIGGGDGVHRYSAGVSLVAVSIRYRGREPDIVIGVTIRRAIGPRVGELVCLVVVRKLVGGVAVAVLERPAAIGVFNAREDLLCAIAFNGYRHVFNVVRAFHELQRARYCIAGISDGRGRRGERDMRGCIVQSVHVERCVGNATDGGNANGKSFGRLGIPTSVVFLRASNCRGQRVGIGNLAAAYAGDHKIAMRPGNGNRARRGVGDRLVVVEQPAVVHGKRLVTNGHSGAFSLMQVNRERTAGLRTCPPCLEGFYLGAFCKVAFIHGEVRNLAQIGGGNGADRNLARSSLIAVSVGHSGRELNGVVCLAV